MRLTAPLTAFASLAAMIACSSPATAPSPPTIDPPAPPSPVGLQCGIERWGVKTLSDADALRVNVLASSPTSISSLTNLPAHCGGGPDRRSFAEEFIVYEVDAIIREVRREDDRDFHIILEDPSSSTDSVIAELPDPACMGVAQSPYIATLSQAHIDFMALLPSGSTNLSTLRGKRVRVRGVGFFDFNHGQTGRARSCIELHPIVSIRAN
jgi:hypothetical protein